METDVQVHDKRSLTFTHEGFEYEVDVEPYFAPDADTFFVETIRSAGPIQVLSDSIAMANACMGFGHYRRPVVRAAWLCVDDHGSDFEWSDETSPDDICYGAYVENPYDAYYSSPYEWANWLRSKYEEHNGRITLVYRQEHGLVRYYSEPFDTTGFYEDEDGYMVPPDGFSRPDGIHVIPSDVTEIEAFSNGVMEEYTSWCNGDVYGVVERTYDVNGNEISDPRDMNECWGFIGYDYAKGCAESAAKGEAY